MSQVQEALRAARKSTTTAKKNPSKERDILERLTFSWLWSMPIMFIGGVVVILIYSSQLPSGLRWSVFGTAVAIASAAFFVGAITGFLFGIPRTVEDSTPSKGVTRYLGNTNLQQVSDWLTKIIVGIGLVQIGHILPALSKLAEGMKAPLGGQAFSSAFGLSLIITYALMGFLYYYLWARELLMRELESSDQSQQRSEINESVRRSRKLTGNPAATAEETVSNPHGGSRRNDLTNRVA